jgi:hypothetical protein
MMWNWASQIDQILQSSVAFVLLVAGGAVLLAIIVIVALARAERAVANVVLAIVTMGALAGSVALFGHGQGSSSRIEIDAGKSAGVVPAHVTPLACLDGLAGELVESACERALFGSAEASASALSYVAAQIDQLQAAGGARNPRLTVMRRAIESDRFGLVARVLDVREGCTPATCEFFKLLVDPSRIAANMNGKAFEAVLARYAMNWTASGGQPVLQGNAPGGKPVSIDFPSASSIPPVNIMTSEPGSPPAAPQATAPKTAATPPKTAATPSAPPANPPRRPKARASAPVPIAPAPAAEPDDN